MNDLIDGDVVSRSEAVLPMPILPTPNPATAVAPESEVFAPALERETAVSPPTTSTSEPPDSQSASPDLDNAWPRLQTIMSHHRRRKTEEQDIAITPPDPSLTSEATPIARKETAASLMTRPQRPPLESVWPVETANLVEKTAVNPAPPAPRSTPPPQAVRPDLSAEEIAQVDNNLQQVAPGKATDSPIELIMPTRPRPVPRTELPSAHQEQATGHKRPVEQADVPWPQAIEQAEQQVSRQAALADNRQPLDTETVVPTEIGPLPADLWQRLGEKPPPMPQGTPQTLREEAPPDTLPPAAKDMPEEQALPPTTTVADPNVATTDPFSLSSHAPIQAKLDKRVAQTAVSDSTPAPQLARPIVQTSRLAQATPRENTIPTPASSHIYREVPNSATTTETVQTQDALIVDKTAVSFPSTSSETSGQRDNPLLPTALPSNPASPLETRDELNRQPKSVQSVSSVPPFTLGSGQSPMASSVDTGDEQTQANTEQSPISLRGNALSFMKPPEVMLVATAASLPTIQRASATAWAPPIARERPATEQPARRQTAVAHAIEQAEQPVTATNHVPIIQRQADLPAFAEPANETALTTWELPTMAAEMSSNAKSDESPAADKADSIDIEALSQQVYREIKRKLAVEWERGNGR